MQKGGRVKPTDYQASQDYIHRKPPWAAQLADHQAWRDYIHRKSPGRGYFAAARLCEREVSVLKPLRHSHQQWKGNSRGNNYTNLGVVPGYTPAHRRLGQSPVDSSCCSWCQDDPRSGVWSEVWFLQDQIWIKVRPEQSSRVAG